MIKSFKIINFKSILETTISLTYREKKAPPRYTEKENIPFLESRHDRLIPLLMLFGANASGKTNLISAIDHYITIINKGIKGLFIPNKLNKKYSSTTFEMSFIWNKNNYIHTIEYDRNHIIMEKFVYKNNTLFEIKEHQFISQNIEAKGYGLEEFKNILSVECSENGLQIKSFLHKLVERLPGLDNNISGACKYLLTNMKVINIGELHPSLIFDWFKKEGISFTDTFKEITPILQLLDLTITRLELIQEEKIGPVLLTPVPVSLYYDKEKNQIRQRLDRIISYHKDTDGKEISFEFFQEESQGTIRLFSIIGAFLLVLKTGGVLVWDELDASLHPCLLRELLKMFKSKRYNTTNAQLITSLHDPYILEDENIRKSDIGIIDNTLIKGTTVTRVVDFENSRNDVNFRKQYLEGHFNGIPNAYL